jgi:predicted metal-dependent peptidase
MMHARTNLVLEEPFFGELAMRLDIFEDPTCETAWVDGKRLGYNRDYVNGLTGLGQAVGLTIHEVLHCALSHQHRRDARDFENWNLACDFAIDPIGIAAKFDIPDPTVNPAWDNKSAEWIYSQLPRPKKGSGGSGQSGAAGQQSQQASGTGSGQGQQPGSGSGKGPSGGKGKKPKGGEVRDAPPDSPTEAEWKTAVAQAAAAARQAGKLPAHLSHLVEQVLKPRLDWRAIMRRWFQEFAKADYSWAHPNRRYYDADPAFSVYLPECKSLSMPPVVFAIDTSGSVSNDEVAACVAEEQSCIDEVQPEMSYLLQCDAEIQHVQEVPAGEELGQVTAHGRGGTSFRPVFDWIKEQQIEPVCIVYLTDMFPCDGWPEDPGIPTLWVSVTEGIKAPWGETLYLNDGGVR